MKYDQVEKSMNAVFQNICVKYSENRVFVFANEVLKNLKCSKTAEDIGGTYTVYVHISPNGKCYVGITKQNVDRRWRNGNGYNTQMFYRAIEKYGWSAIDHIIVAAGVSAEAAGTMEKHLIHSLQSDNPSYGYNIEGGGLSGVVFSEETRRKMSVAAKNRPSPMSGHHHSEGTRKKISKNRSGIPAWNAGKKNCYSEETIAKMREHASRCNLGKHLSEETRKKISDGNCGKTIPLEMKLHLSKIFKGKKSTKEAIQHRADGHKKQVYCVELMLVFPSARDASQELLIDCSSISAVCRGRRKTAGGYHWKFWPVECVE